MACAQFILLDGRYHGLCYVAGSGSGMKRGVDDGSTATTATVQTGGAGTLVPTMLALSVAAAAMVLSK